MAIEDGGGRRSMSTPDESSVWVRTIVGWHLAFWLMLAIAGVATLVDESAMSDRVATLGVLAVLGLAYLLAGAPAADSRDVLRSRTYLAVLVVAVCASIALTPAVSFLLFIAFPQAWFLTDRVLDGALWAAAVAVAATVGFVLRLGFSAEVLRQIGPQMGVSVLFSLLLGVWISRVIDQSQHRAELITELERARTALAEANHSAGVVAERERMAAEIHDTLAQGFLSIVALAQAAQLSLEGHGDRDRETETVVGDRLERIEATARENLAEARGLVAAFAPVPLTDATLAEALRRLAERFTGETGIAVGVEIDPAGTATGLGRGSEVVLLRAAQEALANVRRHADAGHVVLRLHRDATTGAMALEVRDDGRGFDPAAVEGFGLAGMRHRVEDVGGGVDVDTGPGTGTRVRVRVPVVTDA